MISDPFLAPLAVAIVGFVAVWPISALKHDASIVDFLWGPGFLIQLVVASYVARGAAAGGPGPTGLAILFLVGLWSVRLGWVLGRRRLREEGNEDPRYTILRASWGAGFWWKSLFIVFVLQAVLQWAIALGAISGLLATPSPINALAILGILVALAGLGLETRADAELDAFKQANPEGALCTTGLRAHIRHPNYLGEIVFWIGIAMIGLAGGAWLAPLSPVLITIFLTRVSGIPMLDEHLAGTRAGYAAYRNTVPALLPNRLRPSGLR